jgi:intracellular septation protein A
MEASQPAIKHWRTFGADEWRHVRDGVLGLVLGTLLPVGLFYLAFRTISFTAAVIAVLAWSTAIFGWHLQRTGAADVFSATTFCFACVKATAGLVSGDTTLYLAWPSLENMIYGTAFMVSAVRGRPLLAMYAQRLYPISAQVRASRPFQRTFLLVSCVWLVGHTCRAVLRLWLLSLQLPLEVYLLTDTVIGWPINGSLVAFTVWFPLRELRRAGSMSVVPHPDLTTADAVELVVEESAPSTI